MKNPIQSPFSIFIFIIWIWVLWIVIYWVISMYSYYNYKKHISPFENLSIYQTSKGIEFFWPAWDIKWEVKTKIDTNKRKIYFFFERNSKNYIHEMIISEKWLIWYEICYINSYGEYCFWKVK